MIIIRIIFNSRMIRQECKQFIALLACKKGEITAPCNPRPAMSLWSYCSSRGG